MVLSRQKGTLEIVHNLDKTSVKVRQFKDGDVKVLLLDRDGSYIADIADYRNNDGVYDFDVPTKGLKNGLYFLYLIVNNLSSI